MGFVNYFCCCVPCAQILARMRNPPAIQDGNLKTSEVTTLPPTLPLTIDPQNAPNFQRKSSPSHGNPSSTVQGNAVGSIKKKSSSTLFSSPFKKRSSGTTSANSSQSSNQANSREVKLLLLGPGESGKSTIVKQMKILHGSGYSKDELLFYKKDLYRNVLEAMQQTLVSMKQLSIQFHSPEGASASAAVESAKLEDLDDQAEFPKALLKDILFLWNESGLKPLFDRLSQISYVLCSAP